MNIEIKNLTGEVIFKGPKTGLRGAILRRANLYKADLSRANLYKADFSGADLYEADFSGASLHRANLYGANLYGANLRRADLRGADLRGANLHRADLRGASLRGAVGNGLEIISLTSPIWPITYTAEVLQVGCQVHCISSWWGFSDEEISAMDREALAWWKVWKPILQDLIKANPARPTRHEI